MPRKQRSKPLSVPNEKWTAEFTRRSPLLTAVLPGLYLLASNLPTASLARLHLMADQRVEGAFKAPGPNNSSSAHTQRQVSRLPDPRSGPESMRHGQPHSPKSSHRETHHLAMLFGTRHMFNKERKSTEGHREPGD